MFERKKYKDFAKKQLKGRWTVPVLMTLCIFVIMELFSFPNYIKFFNYDFVNYVNSLNSGNFDYQTYIKFINDISYNSTSFITSLIQSLVEGILTMAAIGLYLKMSRSPEGVSFKVFIEGLNNWARAILAALWQFIWVFLWSLLFIIPGIVKSFAYSQMFYILSEYKNVSVTKAMKISMIITKGHKGELFVMGLSFLGWMILCAFTLCIGYLWLVPYMEMSYVNAYHAMLKEALETGRIKPEDLTE